MPSRVKVILAGIAGNALEFYDFALYGVFSAVLAQKFFPQTDQISSLLLVFSTFALGYITRPVGAILFGQLGDSIGRRKTLSLSVLCMAGSTVTIGLLPTYETIGFFAPLLLVLARLVQGVSAGGEYNGAAIFMIEHMPDRKAFAGSMTTVSAASGVILAMLVGSTMLHASLPDWAWRAPFFVGIILGGVAFYIRKKIEETPDFIKVLQTKSVVKAPIWEVLKKYPLEMLCCIGGAAFAGALASTAMGFLPTYLTKFVGMEHNHSLLFNGVGVLSLVLFSPICGYMADRFGNEKLMFFGSIGVIAFSYFMFQWLQTRDIGYILGALVLFHVFVAGFIPVFNAFMNELFPAHVRYSGVALGYGLGIALFGGMMPIASTFLIDRTGSLSSPSFYLMLMGIVGIVITYVGTILHRKKRGLPKTKSASKLAFCQ